MMVLHSKKLIFLKTRKTAGSSFEIALSKYCKSDDIITTVGKKDDQLRAELGFRGPQNTKKTISDVLAHPSVRSFRKLVKGSWPHKYYAHIPAKFAQQRLGPKIWDTYEKVAIVRNPSTTLFQAIIGTTDTLRTAHHFKTGL